MAGITDALSNFSNSLKRFNQSGKTERTVEPDKNKYIEEQLRQRGERLKSNVVATYRIYKSPFEALGEKSDRAALIDGDQQLLLEAYNLYKGVMELNKETSDGEAEIGTRRTFISRIEIASPLVQKAVYTSGGQFIYLMMWLYFEQNCTEYMPVFTEKDNGWNLGFVHHDNFSFDSHDKEIFDIIKNEFYGGE